MALNDGVGPTEFVPNEENPFFSIRVTSINQFTQLENQPGVWEFAFNLTNGTGACVRSLLNSDYTIRVVAVDQNQTLTVFEEFSPAQ